MESRQGHRVRAARREAAKGLPALVLSPDPGGGQASAAGWTAQNCERPDDSARTGLSPLNSRAWEGFPGGSSPLQDPERRVGEVMADRPPSSWATHRFGDLHTFLVVDQNHGPAPDPVS